MREENGNIDSAHFEEQWQFHCTVLYTNQDTGTPYKPAQNWKITFEEVEFR